MRGLVLTLCLAAIWTLLDPEAGPARFLGGCLIGFLFTVLFQRVLQTESFARRTLAAVRFFFVFLWEFVRANLTVAATVLAPHHRRVHPDYLRYDVHDLRKHEVLLLSYLISLMPGTTAVTVQRNGAELVLHVLDARHPRRLRQWLDDNLKRRILAFTR